MGFIVGVVGALLVIFLLSYITIKKPNFGRSLIVLSLLLITLSIFFYFQKENRVDKRRSLISNDEITLSNIKHEYAYGNFYKLTGNIHNQSNRYRLQSITVKISFLQCPEKNIKISDKEVSKNNCELIEDKVAVIKTRLAAEDSGNFEHYLLLEKEKLAGLRWKVELISGIAR